MDNVEIAAFSSKSIARGQGTVYSIPHGVLARGIWDFFLPASRRTYPQSRLFIHPLFIRLQFIASD